MKKNCLKCGKPFRAEEKRFYGLHKGCFKLWFKLKTPASQFKELTRLKLEHSDFISSFFHGKFKKYSTLLEGSSYLMKMKEGNFPELPDVEYLCNKIAQHLKIPVPNFFIIEFKGERVFLTKIFSKKSELTHIYHFLESEKEHNCKNLIEIIKNKARPKDIKTFVFTTLFDSLIGNHDRHGRNLAFLSTGTQCRLSPIYDNVSYLALEKKEMLSSDQSPRGSIFTSQSKEPTVKDYVKEFSYLNLSKHTEELFKNIKKEEIKTLFEESFCSDSMKKALKKLFYERYEEFKDALQIKNQ